jgi:hypothetical protein
MNDKHDNRDYPCGGDYDNSWTIKVWKNSHEPPQEFVGLTDQTVGVAFCGDRLFAGDLTGKGCIINVWNIDTGEKLAPLRHADVRPGSWVTRLATDPVRARVYSTMHTRSANRVVSNTTDAFNVDGTFLRRREQAGPDAMVAGVCVTKCGKVAIVTARGLELWDPKDGSRLCSWDVDAGGSVEPVHLGRHAPAASPNGQVATALAGSMGVILWSENLKQLQTIKVRLMLAHATSGRDSKIKLKMIKKADEHHSLIFSCMHC